MHFVTIHHNILPQEKNRLLSWESAAMQAQKSRCVYTESLPCE